MDISFACDSCGKHLVVDEAGAGITIDCPDCGKPICVPSKAPPSRQDTPVRVEVKSTKPKSASIPAPVTRNNPLFPPSSVREKSTIHPAIAAGVHCLLILIGIQFVGFVLMRENLLWSGIFMIASVPFMVAPLLCAVYGMCVGHVRHGLLVLAGLALIFGFSYWVMFSSVMPGSGASQRRIEEMQRQFQK